MKKSAFAFLLALTTSSFAGMPDTSSKNPVVAPPAPESDAGFFVDCQVGNFLLNSFSAGSPLKLDFKFKEGWDSTLGFGYDFGNGFSALLSGGYYRGYQGQVSLHEDGISQNANTWGYMSFEPFLAGGSYSVKLVDNLS